VFALLFVAALIGQTQAAPASCWTKIGPRAQYGASDQVRDLQNRVKGGGCEVIGLAWTTTAAPSQESVLLWEAKPQTLWRLTMDPQGPRWERWSGASRERILGDNPGDGFTLGAYNQGKGRAATSLSAGGFVKQHAAGTFDAVLPENCSAPSPAGNAPAFLTKCGG
jgi:hypothetical protein